MDKQGMADSYVSLRINQACHVSMAIKDERKKKEKN